MNRILKFVALMALAMSPLTATADISQSEAEQIVLGKYPNLLANATQWGPNQVPTDTDIGEFGPKGTIVWWLKVRCANGGLHASILVHAESGKMFEVLSPGDRRFSEKCESQ